MYQNLELKEQTDILVKLLEEVPLGELKESNFSKEYGKWLKLIIR